MVTLRDNIMAILDKSPFGFTVEALATMEGSDIEAVQHNLTKLYYQNKVDKRSGRWLSANAPTAEGSSGLSEAVEEMRTRHVVDARFQTMSPPELRRVAVILEKEF